MALKARSSFQCVEIQQSREPRLYPQMKLNPAVKDLFDFTFEEFTLGNYDPWLAIKAHLVV